MDGVHKFEWNEFDTIISNNRREQPRNPESVFERVAGGSYVKEEPSDITDQSVNNILMPSSSSVPTGSASSVRLVCEGYIPSRETTLNVDSVAGRNKMLHRCDREVQPEHLQVSYTSKFERQSHNDNNNNMSAARTDPSQTAFKSESVDYMDTMLHQSNRRIASECLQMSHNWFADMFEQKPGSSTSNISADQTIFDGNNDFIEASKVSHRKTYYGAKLTTRSRQDMMLEEPTVVCTSKRRVSSEQNVAARKRKLSAVTRTTTNAEWNNDDQLHPNNVARNAVDTSAAAEAFPLNPIEQIVPFRGDVASHLIHQNPRFAKMISKFTKKIEKSSTVTTSGTVPPNDSGEVINFISVFDEVDPTQQGSSETAQKNPKVEPQIADRMAQQLNSLTEDASSNHSTNQTGDIGGQKEMTEVTDHRKKHIAQQGADDSVMEEVRDGVEEGEVSSSCDSDSSIADNEYYDHKQYGKGKRERSPSESSDSSTVQRYRFQQSSKKEECSHHCQYCLMRFDMLSTKLKHEITVHGNERCHCNPCSSTFTQRRMDVHMRKSHRSQLHCYICHFQADTRWKIADHKESCH